MQSCTNSLIEGVQKLRSSSLLEIITSILLIIGMMSILSVIGIGIGGVIVMLVIFLIAILTDILGILRIRKGFSILNSAVNVPPFMNSITIIGGYISCNPILPFRISLITNESTLIA
jgi:nitrate reductase NapE component